MHNKYKNLDNKTPEETALIVGDVEKSNYLAHSIREIELAILRLKGKHYHIVTYLSKSKKSKATFHDNCCIISLPVEYEQMEDNRAVRLILAHELGHLVFNLEKLLNPEILENSAPSDEEEKFAWEFAFHLICKKSNEYADHIRLRSLVHKPEDIKRTLAIIIKNKVQHDRPMVYDSLMQSLNLTHYSL